MRCFKRPVYRTSVALSETSGSFPRSNKLKEETEIMVANPSFLPWTFYVFPVLTLTVQMCTLDDY